MQINNDIETHRLKEKIRALEKENKQLNEIIAVLPGHIYWKDRQGVLLGCNDEQAKDSGLKSRYHIRGLKEIDLISELAPETFRLREAANIENI